MKGYMTRLDFPVFLVDLVPNQNYGYALTNSPYIFVPHGHIFVSNPGSHIEHKNSSAGPNIVALAQSSRSLLARGIPERKVDGPAISTERN